MTGPIPNVSIFNFHYATPPDAVAMNYGLNKPIADDETGFKGNGDAVYRKEAWQFMMNGGAAFSHLDYSFNVGHEAGDFAIPNSTPGGGGKSVSPPDENPDRFSRMVFHLRAMKPAREVVKTNGATVYALAENGKHYALYLHGKTPDIALDLPAGNFKIDWLNVETGAIEKSENCGAQRRQKNIGRARIIKRTLP